MSDVLATASSQGLRFSGACWWLGIWQTPGPDASPGHTLRSHSRQSQLRGLVSGCNADTLQKHLSNS